MNPIDRIKDFIATRGFQWGGRIALSLVIYVAGKFGAKIDDDTQTQVILIGGVAFMALGYWLVDKWSHKQQIQDVAARAFDNGADAVVDHIEENDPAPLSARLSSPVTIVKLAAEEVKSQTRVFNKLP